jgi:hypothetical protein
VWNTRDLVRIARDGLQAVSDMGTREQAVYGIDALAEVDLHPFLSRAFRDAGFGVQREWPYPGEAGKRPKHQARNRCDLVLTPGPDQPLLDPVQLLREEDASIGTLFAPTVAKEVASRPGVRPEEAFWLEVKVVGQYCFTQGVPGPNQAWASELTGSLATDLKKLAADGSLAWAGLLLVLFTADDQTADHDLNLALHRSLDKGLTFRAPIIERFAMLDRIGNASCTLALVPAGA